MKKDKKDKKNKSISNKLTKNAVLMSGQDKCWNFIPLGVTINNKKEQIIGWYLNDQNIVDEAYPTLPSTSLVIAGGTGSGKTIMERSIISHINDYSDYFQLVLSDPRKVDFFDLMSNNNCRITDTASTASAAESIQKVMMRRFKLMEKYQVNNIHKLVEKQAEVDYYTIKGIGTFQFDEIIPLTIALDALDTKDNKLSKIYTDGKRPVALSADDIYNQLKNGEIKDVTIQNRTITEKDIKVSKNAFVPRDIVFMIDDLATIMTDANDYRSVDIVKQALGSIARLGRAAGTHLVLCCQRASGSIISTDLMNNISMSVLLGGFDDAASYLMFNQDISNRCRPEIRGRGFIGSGNEIIETQIFSGKFINF